MKKFLKFVKSEIGRIILSLAFFIPALITEHTGVKILPEVLFVISLMFVGLPVLFSAVKGIIRRDFLDEKFLMTIAAVGAVILGEMSEGVAVMLFFAVGEYFEHRAVAHSRKSIKSLMEICPDEATLLANGREERVDAEDVELGSLIIIKAGERVPLDSVVVSGSADLDTSALTGESIPRAVNIGDRIESGSVVLNGALTARTEKTLENSAASRILSLVENASERKSKAENFITKFSRYYTPIVVALAILLVFIPPIFGLLKFNESIYRALTFLVISCPCALVISVPMAFFGGIGAGAKKGILYKGGNVFSPLSKAETFVFDKTGTLTNGTFKVSKVTPCGVSEEELLYLAASAESGSNHPIAKCIADASGEKTMPKSVKEFAGKGIVAEVENDIILVGNMRLLGENGVEVKSDIEEGSVLVAKNGCFIGEIEISDNIKKEAQSAVNSLRKCGVKNTVMLSGDRMKKAESVANELSLDAFRAELLPSEKYSALEEIISKSKSTVYVGDGINDAPSIARADVGIAMGEIGSDSAIESADVVIMHDSLDRLPLAIKIARKTLRIASENIVFALSLKILVLILGSLGIANMWLAVFADVGVAVLAILNSMRTLR